MSTASPTIYERLSAAVQDNDERYAIVYYKRNEGATRAAINIAKANKENIIIVNVDSLKWLYKDYDVKFINTQSEFPIGKIIIADALPHNVLKVVKLKARDKGCKLVAIKVMED